VTIADGDTAPQRLLTRAGQRSGRDGTRQARTPSGCGGDAEVPVRHGKTGGRRSHWRSALSTGAESSDLLSAPALSKAEGMTGDRLRELPHQARRAMMVVRGARVTLPFIAVVAQLLGPMIHGVGDGLRQSQTCGGEAVAGAGLSRRGRRCPLRVPVRSDVDTADESQLWSRVLPIAVVLVSSGFVWYALLISGRQSVRLG
jgi:hypothetical protein